MNRKLMVNCAAFLGLTTGTVSAWGIEGNTGNQNCVPIQNIQSSPAINDKTILLELNGHKYKRIDLANSCAGVSLNGFSYDTSTQDLCVTNTLHVNEAAGASCMIKDIVDITAEEAKALRMRQ